jgi:glutathione S-transferase
MIVVHHLENSRSQRILWLLEELGVAYKVKRYERDKKTMLAPDSLREVHPLGRSPVITDGTETVAESGAIIEYILDKYGQGRLRPAPGSPDARRFTFWLHYAEGSAMPPLLIKLVFDQIEKKSPLLLKPVALAISQGVKLSFLNAEIKNHLGYMNDELTSRPWFAGEEFSAADIQMSFPLEAAAGRAGLKSSYPNLDAFLEKIRARPAYQAALKKGGPYDLGEMG